MVAASAVMKGAAAAAALPDAAYVRQAAAMVLTGGQLMVVDIVDVTASLLVLPLRACNRMLPLQ
jgi:hypothetical protein